MEYGKLMTLKIREDELDLIRQAADAFGINVSATMRHSALLSLGEAMLDRDPALANRLLDAAARYVNLDGKRQNFRDLVVTK